MNSYKIRTPRIAIGFGATAMSALTIGALVVLPAQVEVGNSASASVAASRPAAEPSARALPEVSLSVRKAARVQG